MPGCELHVTTDVYLPLVNTAGTAILSLPLPNHASRNGAGFFNQSVVVDPPANALGVITSNAGVGRIGAR